jgi:hypothetical protein
MTDDAREPVPVFECQRYQYEKRERATHVMKEVRASTSRVSSVRTLSRYLVIDVDGRNTELIGEMVDKSSDA